MKAIDRDQGRKWAKTPVGWAEMPTRYDPAKVTDDDLVNDYALRRLTQCEVEEAEQCTS